MKFLALNVWLICMLALFTSLDAQQRLSRVNERSEAPIEVPVDKSEKPEPENNKQNEVDPEEILNETLEKIYPVNGFSLSYGKEHIDLPAIEQLDAIEVHLKLNSV